MTITINVSKITEGNDTYFLAESKDIKGFLVEGNTFDDIVNFSPEIANMLLLEKDKREKKEENFIRICESIKDRKYVYSPNF